MRRVSGAALYLSLVLISADASVGAQSPAGAGTVRYQFGDDPQWAASGFDDTTWPSAPGGSVPARGSTRTAWSGCGRGVPFLRAQPVSWRCGGSIQAIIPMPPSFTPMECW